MNHSLHLLRDLLQDGIFHAISEIASHLNETDQAKLIASGSRLIREIRLGMDDSNLDEVRVSGTRNTYRPDTISGELVHSCNVTIESINEFGRISPDVRERIASLIDSAMGTFESEIGSLNEAFSPVRTQEIDAATSSFGKPGVVGFLEFLYNDIKMCPECYELLDEENRYKRCPKCGHSFVNHED